MRLLASFGLLLALAACDIAGVAGLDSPADLNGKTNKEAGVTAAQIADTSITGFTFVDPAATGVVDDAAGTVAIIVPFGTPPNALTPTITLADGATISPLSGGVQNFTKPVTYTVTAKDKTTTKKYTVTVTVATNTAKDITAFSVSGSTSTVISSTGGTTGTIVVTVPVGTYRYALTPTFSASGNSVAVGTTVQTSGSTVQDFSSSVSYVVTAADLSTKTNTVSVSTPSPLYDLVMLVPNTGSPFPLKLDISSGALTALTVPTNWTSTNQTISSDIGGKFVAAGIYSATPSQRAITTMQNSGSVTDLGTVTGPIAGNFWTPVFASDGSKVFFWASGQASVYGFPTSSAGQANSWVRQISAVPSTIASLLIGPAGHSAYLLNAMNATPAVQSYTINNNGSLTGGTSQSTGTINAPVAQILAPKGTHLYVLEQNGNLEVLPVNEATLGTASGQLLPVSPSVAAGTWMSFTAPTSVLPPATPPPLLMDPNGKFLYVVGATTTPNNHLIETFKLDPTTGAATYQSAVDRGTSWISYVVVNKTGTKGFVFFMAGNSTVDVYNIDPATGGWSITSPLREWTPNNGGMLNVDPSGTWVISTTVQVSAGPINTLSVQAWNTATGVAGTVTSLGNVSSSLYNVELATEVFQ